MPSKLKMRTFQFCAILFSLCCVPITLSAQSEGYRDSLLAQIEISPSDKKIELAKIYARQFHKITPEQVTAVLEENLSQTLLTSLDSIDFYYLLSKAYYYQYNLKKHTASVETANKLLKKYNGPKNEYYNFLKYQENMLIAKNKYHNGFVAAALDAYLDASKYADLANNKESKANVLREIGAFYIEQKEPVSALKYLKESQNIGLEKKTESEDYYVKLYAELSEAYLRLNELDSVRKYIDLIPPEKYSPVILFTIAGYYSRTDAPVEAIVFLDAIIAKTKTGGLKHWLPFAHMKKGDNLIKLKRYKEAEDLWLKAKLQFEEINDDKNLFEVSNRLFNYYKDQGESAKADTYYKIVSKFQENTHADNYSAALKGVESSHTLREKEIENQALREKGIINESIIQRQKLICFLGTLCILALSGLVFVYFKTSKTTKRLNKELEQANENLMLKNKETKAIADELSFITDHFPEGVAKLNKDFLITYCNDHFKNCVKVEQDALNTNIFQLLGFSSNDLTSLERDLNNQQVLSFTWKSPENDKVYQVQTVNINGIKNQSEYLLVMEDITQLKQAEKLRFIETEQRIRNLEKDYEENFEKNAYQKNVLSQSLASKKKELASKMMQIAKRNTDLENIISHLREIYASSNSTTKLKLTKVISKLNGVLDIEDGWETFNTYFQEIHPYFLKELRSKNDNLTNNEIRHCTYIKLGLTNKEVANMLYIAPKSVEAARYRIKKKLNLSKEDSLSQFILNIKSLQRDVK